MKFKFFLMKKSENVDLTNVVFCDIMRLYIVGEYI